MVSMRNRYLLSISLAGLTLIAAGCKKTATYSTRDGSVTVEQKGNDASSMTFSSKDGKSVTMNVGGDKIPDDYPKDLPVYPGAKVMVTQSLSEKNARTLMLESTDPADKIAEFYKKGLESNGWKIENTMTSGEMNIFTAAKENRQAVLQIMNGGDKRTINQVISDK